MSARTDVKSEVKQDTKTNAEKTRVDMAHFKPYAAPKRRGGLQENQIAVSKHSISMPLSVATKLGEKVALLWSDVDKAIAIQKAPDGDYKLRQVGKSNRSRSIYCKTLLDVKKVKKGRYTTQFDEKNQMLIARVA